jgi:hypothetical protein
VKANSLCATKKLAALSSPVLVTSHWTRHFWSPGSVLCVDLVVTRARSTFFRRIICPYLCCWFLVMIWWRVYRIEVMVSEYLTGQGKQFERLCKGMWWRRRRTDTQNWFYWCSCVEVWQVLSEGETSCTLWRNHVTRTGVCLSACSTVALSGRMMTKFDIWVFCSFENLSRNFKFH